MDEEVQGDGSTEAQCRELDADLSSVRRLESSSDSNSPGEASARKTYGSENVPTAVIKARRSTTWRKDLTAR